MSEVGGRGSGGCTEGRALRLILCARPSAVQSPLARGGLQPPSRVLRRDRASRRLRCWADAWVTMGGLVVAALVGSSPLTRGRQGPGSPRWPGHPRSREADRPHSIAVEWGSGEEPEADSAAAQRVSRQSVFPVLPDCRETWVFRENPTFGKRGYFANVTRPEAHARGQSLSAGERAGPTR